ncbi:MAG: glycosyltransferase family 4 protein [Thermoanaerobaculia bacterium]|nr:glycosyltransferase family 4 protein [Thermoanaerobaculia bacterium]
MPTASEPSSASKPRLLVLSSVLPFPANAGQKQRVRLKLASFRRQFHVTFLTPVAARRCDEVRDRLESLCDEALLIESRWRRGVRGLLHPAISRLWGAAKGLKASNYVAEHVDLTPRRVLAALGDRRFDLAVVEYWHATGAVRALCRQGIPCVLDMHNLLWQSRQRQLSANRLLPQWWRRFQVARYRRQEEAAWEDYQGLITINSREDEYVQQRLPSMQRFYAPMGTDLDAWSFEPRPAAPPRIAYYGGLGSVHNRNDARTCYREILPRIRAVHPDAELWIVGSRPPDDLVRSATSDPHLVVTGFVEEVQDVLRTMSLVLCPWVGTYGFRSRLVEVLALGVPVVASPDAVDGMDLRHGSGIFLAPDFETMAMHANELLGNEELRAEQGRLGREDVEQSYSFDATYGRLTRELFDWSAARGEGGDAFGSR